MASKTILILDDEPQLRTAARRALEKAGFEVEDLASAVRGLERLRADPPPALVLLDVLMPEMDGWEFLAALAKDPAAAKVPVVLCSATVDLEHSKLPAGIDVAGKIDKPFTSVTLVDAVKRALARDTANRF
ncbi:MAG TPA: response regulator [bacterium]|nr:response regulator [bacterium]